MSKNGCIKSIHNPMIDYQIPLVFSSWSIYSEWNVSFYFSNDTNAKKSYWIQKHSRKCTLCQYISIAIITKYIAINIWNFMQIPNPQHFPSNLNLYISFKCQ